MAGQRTITGVVYDSTRSAPLVGASVTLVGTSTMTATDSAGRFTLSRISGGAYSLSFTHPRLDSLRYSPIPVRVLVSPPATLRSDLAIPPLATVLTSGCSFEAGGTASGALAGFVKTSEGVAVAGVPMVAKWQNPAQVGDTLSAVAASDDGGAYRFCSLPAGLTLQVGPAAGSTREIRLASAERVQLDFSVLAPAPDRPVGTEGSAEVRGRLVEAGTSGPIVGAVVRFGRGLPEQTTDRKGEFVMRGVPGGSYGVEFSHDDYGIGTSQVVVPRGGILEFELSVPKRTVTLAPIEVTAERILPAELNRRSRGSRLDIIARPEIEKLASRAQHIGDLVRRIPGMTVTNGMNGQVCIQNSNAPGAGGALGGGTARSPTECAPVQIILDDVPMSGSTTAVGMIPVSGLESIIYLKPTDAMMRYGFLGERGVLLVYTRGNGPTVGEE